MTDLDLTRSRADAWRRTARTVVAGGVALAVTAPLLIDELHAAGIDVLALAPWLATVLAVLAALTRVMASPQVDGVLTRAGIGRAPKHRAGDLEPPPPPPSTSTLPPVQLPEVVIKVPAGVTLDDFLAELLDRPRRTPTGDTPDDDPDRDPPSAAAA